MTQHEQNTQLLIRLMEVSELDYHNNLMDIAYEYLDNQVGKDIFGKDVLLRSKFFWDWWKNQWNRRNGILIHRLDLDEVCHILQPKIVRLLRKEYQNIHSVKTLNIYPSRIVIEASYAVMVGNVIDNELKVKR